QFGTARHEENAENRPLAKALPAMERIISQASDSLQRPGTPPSPGLTALFNAGKEAEQQIYVTFADGRIYIVTARPRRDDLNDKAVQRLRELVGQTKVEVPGINIGITGEPVLEYDEMAQSQHDTAVATIVSLVLVALIFIYGYNESGRPIKATLGLLVCLVPMMILLPVLLLRGRQNVLDHTFRQEIEKRARLEKMWLERPLLVAGITAALCAVSVAKFPRVHFHYNLLHMQSKGLPAVVFEQKLIDSAEKSVLYCAVIATSLTEALELEAKVTRLPAVGSVDSMARYLSEDQPRKL